MELDVMLASIHHLAVFGLFVVLAIELALLMAPLEPHALKRLGRVDSVYGLVALIALAAGLSRAVYGTKGWAFYSANPVFWSKLGLFVVIGLISIKPTLQFIRWRKAAMPVSDDAQRQARNWVKVQLVLLFALPLLAALMARGVGLNTAA
jgi:putative membrane protein